MNDIGSNILQYSEPTKWSKNNPVREIKKVGTRCSFFLVISSYILLWNLIFVKGTTDEVSHCEMVNLILEPKVLHLNGEIVHFDEIVHFGVNTISPKMTNARFAPYVSLLV